MTNAAAPGLRLGNTARALWRYAWPLPYTLAGLLLALPVLLCAGQARRVAGVLEVSGGLLGRWSAHTRWLPFGVQAITLGHVIVGSSAAVLSSLRAHEHAHVRQYERWGVLFMPAYVASSVWQLLRGRHVYRDNVFERQARRVEGCLRMAVEVPAFHPLSGPPPGSGRQ